MSQTTRIGNWPLALTEIYQNASNAEPRLTPWERLVERYKDDRKVCNCRQAWYMRIGEDITRWDGYNWRFEKNENPDACMYGCQHNQLACKQEIGKRIAEEFGI